MAMMAWIFLVIGLALLILGIFLLYTTHYWFLNLTVCSLPDKLFTFQNPNMAIHDYFCHDA